MRQDKRIPKLVSIKIEIRQRLTPFLAKKNCRKRSKTGKIAKFARFRPFFGKKNGAKCCPIFILRADLEYSHPGASF